VRVGDLVRHGRESNLYETLGIIIEVEARPLSIYTDEEVKAKPIRRIKVLQSNGTVSRWWACHAEVISEVTV
jgi:hypothetical protein|tara:strand:- start:274 stop:489 length:216 start_codon:yes stop_codon:yes gene_type:complete